MVLGNVPHWWSGSCSSPAVTPPRTLTSRSSPAPSAPLATLPFLQEIFVLYLNASIYWLGQPAGLVAYESHASATRARAKECTSMGHAGRQSHAVGGQIMHAGEFSTVSNAKHCRLVHVGEGQPVHIT